VNDHVVVPIGPCGCTGTPHDGDEVYLARHLSMTGGMAAQAAISESDGDAIRLQELLARIWISHGIVGWNLVDADGDPLPVDTANVAARLPYGKGGMAVAERADDLYAEDILAPLRARLKRLSQLGSTDSGPRPTSRAAGSTKKRPSPSSTATTDQEPRSA